MASVVADGLLVVFFGIIHYSLTYLCLSVFDIMQCQILSLSLSVCLCVCVYVEGKDQPTVLDTIHPFLSVCVLHV